MNERLRQLMVQADYPAPEIALRAQKLAQLIVRECMQACINMGNDYEIKSAGQYQAELFAFAIKQHFGVEEPKGWICPKCSADRTKIACPLGFGATVDGRCPMTVEAQ